MDTLPRYVADYQSSHNKYVELGIEALSVEELVGLACFIQNDKDRYEEKFDFMVGRKAKVLTHKSTYSREERGRILANIMRRLHDVATSDDTDLETRISLINNPYARYRYEAMYHTVLPLEVLIESIKPTSERQGLHIHDFNDAYLLLSKHPETTEQLLSEIVQQWIASTEYFGNRLGMNLFDMEPEDIQDLPYKQALTPDQENGIRRIRAMMDDRLYILGHLVEHPNVTDAVLKKLIQFRESSLDVRAATHPRAGKKTLEELAGRQAHTVRLALASHKNIRKLGTKTVERLATDPDERVRKAVHNNPDRRQLIDHLQMPSGTR
jgi:hypothetical protein